MANRPVKTYSHDDPAVQRPRQRALSNTVDGLSLLMIPELLLHVLLLLGRRYLSYQECGTQCGTTATRAHKEFNKSTWGALWSQAFLQIIIPAWTSLRRSWGQFHIPEVFYSMPLGSPILWLSDYANTAQTGNNTSVYADGYQSSKWNISGTVVCIILG